MAMVTAPTTVNIALLADLHPQTGRPDRLHAVLAWTDRGDRYYARLVDPVTTAADTGVLLGLPSAPAQQLQLDLGDVVGSSYCSSSGLTWRTWALASIPAALRHLTVDRIAGELARRLAG